MLDIGLLGRTALVTAAARDTAFAAVEIYAEADAPVVLGENSSRAAYGVGHAPAVDGSSLSR